MYNVILKYGSKNYAKNLVSLLAFISLLLFSACDLYNITEDSITSVKAVDSYVKDATLRDSKGQKATYDGKNATYTFTSNITYPIYLSGGRLEETNEIFDVEMTAQSGLVISPITTFIKDDDVLRQKLTNQGFPYINSLRGFAVDYINIDNADLAKLAQVFYVMLRDKEIASAFKDDIKKSIGTSGSLKNLIIIAGKVIDNSLLKENIKKASKRLLKSIKDYDGTADDIEKNLENDKKNLINGGKKILVVPTLDDFISFINEDINLSKPIGYIIFDDGGSAITSFTLTGPDNTYFKIANDGAVTANTTFNAKVKDRYKLTLKAKNNIGDSNTVDFIIDIAPIRTNGKLINVTAVQGVDYETDKGNIGTTNNEGAFAYDTKDSSITFKIGSLIIAQDFDLSKLNSDGIILPSDIVGVDRNNTSNKNMIKLLRVLQSLDNNNDSIDGIFINDATKGKLGRDINIVDEDISTLKTIVENAEKTFKSQRNSRERYIQTLKDMNIIPELMPFIVVVKAPKGKNIKIITDPDLTYNYTVDWGDGNINNNINNNIIHKYSRAGNKTIKISGTFPTFKTVNDRSPDNNEKDSARLLQKIEQWGDIAWSTFNISFAWTKDLHITATDTPDLKNVTSMEDMFFRSGISGHQSMNDWDVSSVTNMKNLFAGTENFNQDISNWDVSSVTNMYGLFSETKIFNQDVTNWDVSSVTNMMGMFFQATKFNQGLLWGNNTSNVTDMGLMFNGASAFTNQNLSGWKVDKVTKHDSFATDSGGRIIEPTWKQ